ncbi:MAG TPA: glycosyltransferase [Bryobacteraceae bacterium]|nr:glycosyltransferase [Bryobacteraceae bacterium]
MHRRTITIPCYNEASRLDVSRVRTYLGGAPLTTLVFVNDGSTDSTLALLYNLRRETPYQVHVLDLPRNGGKAEAVRQGLLYGIRDLSAEVVGFWDADLATPLEAIDDFDAVLERRPDIDMVFGSRVRLLGRQIERKLTRHYFGRLFATCASLVLDLPIYDTQCGAKLFRVTPQLTQVLESPFRSRWIFDVEMIARFIRAYRAVAKPAGTWIYEFPLHAWIDVAGSKVRIVDFLRAGIELALIWRQHTICAPQCSSDRVMAAAAAHADRH